MGAVVIMECCIGLFIISLIFWNLAQFFLIYFISTISTNKKSGLIINSLLSSGTLITGYLISSYTLNRGLQLFLSLFPNINICFSVRNILKLQFMGQYKQEHILLNYNNINYLEILIMSVVSMVIYFFLGILVKSYKLSGLSFCLFLKSNRWAKIE